MKIISLNVNGLKAFYNRGNGDGTLLKQLIADNDPDVVLFNEIKCNETDYYYWLSDFEADYLLASSPNKYKKGYAGVGAMIKKNIDFSHATAANLINSEYDSGRILCLEFPKFYIVGTYVLNSGDKDDLRQDWNKEFKAYLQNLLKTKSVLVLGDLNVCSRHEDCWAFDQYFDDMPGVKGYEIDQFHDLLKECNFIDSFIYKHPNIKDKYSWFSYRGNSRWTNKGFRLDYALVPESLQDKIISSEILGKACQYSDHSPILLDIDI